MLLENNLNRLYFFQKVSFFFLFFFMLILSVVVFIKHNVGLNYLFFSLLSFFLIYYSFYRSKKIIPKIFSVFIFLGFWFKFTIVSLYYNKIFGEGTGKFVFDLENLNILFNFCNIGFLFIILACKYQINFNYREYGGAGLKWISIFFNRNDIVLLFFYFLTLFFIIFLNLKYKIFLRGIVITYNELISLAFNGFYSFFFIIISSLMLDFHKNKKIYIIVFILTILLLSITSYSRMAPLLMLITIIAFYYLNYFNLKFIKSNIIFPIIFLVSFFISIQSTKFINSIRVCDYINKGKDCVYLWQERQERREGAINWDILIQRWVGIDSLMFVLGRSNDSADVFSKEHFVKSSKEFVRLDENFISVKTPGPFAFFAQFKSYILFSTAIFSSVYLLFFFENFLIFFIKKYRFTFLIVSFLLVWKFLHIGLGGINTIFFYFSLLLFIVLLYFVNYFLKIKVLK